MEHFETEPRREFTDQGRKRVYAPDALFFIDEKPFILEVQRTRLTKERWKKKWEVAESFFHGKPTPVIILVKTQQPKETVSSHTTLPVHVFKGEEDLLSLLFFL